MPVRSHDDLTVAIIHFQTPDLLERCLAAVRTAGPAARILVVDTGEEQPLPDDWTWPGAELVREPNHSYAAAVNSALRRCNTHRFTHMNADVFVEPGTFDDLALAMEASGAAMAGPLPRHENGKLQRNGLPYRLYQWRLERAAKRGTAAAAAPATVAVPWLSGCLQYLRMDAARLVGGMDSSLRFYNEDLEWCLRLRAAGERCVLVATPVVHLGGSSSTSASAPIVEGMRGGYLVTRKYRGPLLRALHRLGVFVWASVAAQLERGAIRRSAYGQVAAMFHRGEFDESPFGETLGKRNPRFLIGERRTITQLREVAGTQGKVSVATTDAAGREVPREETADRNAGATIGEAGR